MNFKPGQLKELLQKHPTQKRRVSHNESALQQNCVRWFDAEYAGIYTKLVETKQKRKGIKIPVTKNVRVSALMMLANAGKRSKIGGGYAIAEGLSTGAADLFLAVPKQIITSGQTRTFGLFIEMKYGTNKQSLAQTEFQKLITGIGFQYELIYDFDSFRNLIHSYLGIPKKSAIPNGRS